MYLWLAFLHSAKTKQFSSSALLFLSKTKRYQIPCYKKVVLFFVLRQVSTLNERLERKETELSEFKTKYDQECENWKSQVSDVLCELTER